MSGISEGCHKETDIGILQVRVENLSSTVSEVKVLIQRIEEAVGIVKIVQVHADQQANEYEKLTSIVKELSSSVNQLEDAMSKELQNSNAANSQKLKALEDQGFARESKWKEKYDTFRGIIIGITMLGGALSGFSIYTAKTTSLKIEESYQYVQQLKTLDALTAVKKHLSVKGGQND